MKRYAIGIDVGGTTVKIGLFTETGDVVKKWEVPTRKEENGKYVLPDVADSIKETLKEEQIAMTDVEGAGLDVPGAVLANGVVNKCVNLGWGVMDAGAEMSALLDGMKVKVANDANAAGLGELWKGGGVGHKGLVMITLGTGVGGAVVINEQIIPGAFGAAGEIGHMMMNENETEACNCGKKGCLEQYASASRIALIAEKRVAAYEGDTMLRRFEHPIAKDVFDAAKAGDALALQLVDEIGEVLGKACALISAVVDPEVFVIGGGVSKAGPILIEAIEKHYGKYAFHASRETEFALATLGNDAGIYGAVKLVL